MIRVEVSINWDIDFNRFSTPQSDVFGQGFESRVVCDVVVVDVQTLRDFVDKLLLSFEVAHPHKGNHRDSHRDSRLLA